MGGVVGAAVGLPAALFTFGLSIPVCAVVGATVGGTTGATVGGTTGAVGGGATGYYGYKHKDSIKAGYASAEKSVKDSYACAEKSVKDSVHNISDRVSSVLGRGGSTGGTA